MAEAGSVPLITAEHLVKDFGGRGGGVRAVNDVSLRVDSGHTLGIVGESGSGKSTLARLVMRLIEPTSGTLRFRDRDLLALRGKTLRAQRRNLQMVFQSPYGSLLPNYTVAANIAEPLRLHRIGDNRQRRSTAVRLLDTVGLHAGYADMYPRRLSGGQQQRVAIARALALEPELLVCDEPTSSLDVSIQAQILTLLTELQRSLGFSMLFITHNLAVVQRLADDIMVMNSGQVVEAGPTRSIFEDPQNRYTKTLLSSVLPIRSGTRRIPG